MTHLLFRGMFNLQIFWKFPAFFKTDFYTVVWDYTVYDFYSFKFVLLHGPECGLSGWLFHVSYRRMWVLLLLDEVVYKDGSSWLMDGWHWVQLSLLIFCLLDLSIADREVLKSPAKIMNSSVSPCSSVRFCLMCCILILLLKVYTWIVTRPWIIDLLIIII